jgi:HEPN domain-containing protein
MINVKKQILYWEKGAGEELLNAKIMIENQRFLPCLFFCHLCLEKILKALVVKTTEQHPGRTHILSSLADTAQINFDEQQYQFITEIQAYHLEGRYPENFPSEPGLVETQMYFEQTLNLYQWLKAKL